MRRIGLTGGIATGKSTVSRTLRVLGAPVIDADEISRALTAPGGEALPALRARFGDAVFDGDALNRRALGAVVFTDAQAREALGALLHPMVYARMEARCAELAQAGAPAAVLEIPLLFETGYDARVDEIWLTVLPQAEQLRRLMARNGLTEAEAAARIDSQWRQEDKRARAQRVFDTTAAPDAVAAQVRAAWAQSIRKA